ncbi:MAG: hypothetical protein EXR79_06455 [Myxococcales bacterium]|nr:hypothetical protein [Myxococcales bacterium]
MPIKRPDLPPPMPSDDDGPEHTMIQGSAGDRSPQLPDDLLEDLPGDLPHGRDFEPRAGTGEQMMHAFDEGDLAAAPPPNLRKALERRMPAPRGQRPTLLPAGFEMPPKLPGAPKTGDPALVRPMRPGIDASKQNVGQPRESSDIIAMFAVDGPKSVPTPMQNRGGPVSRPPPAAPPPAAGRLIRRPAHPPQQPAAPTALPGGAAAPQFMSNGPQFMSNAPQFMSNAPQFMSNGPQFMSNGPQFMANGPQLLPLHADRVYALVGEHRSRLALLDLWARGLEIGAGLLGTVALAVLIASLVTILMGRGGDFVGGATAIVASCGALALTAVMVALSTTLRHVAHVSAQVAALLDALSGR